MIFAWQFQMILQLLLKKEMTLPIHIFAFLVLAAAFIAIIHWYERYLAEKLGQNYVHEIRLVLYDALSRNKDYNQKRNGIHMVRFSNDLTSIRQWISLGIARLVSLFLLFCGITFSLTILDIEYAVLVFFSFILSLFAIQTLGWGIEKSIKESRAKRGKLANCVNEIINNIPQISLFGRTKFERERLNKQSKVLVNALTHRAFWLGSLSGLSELCINIIAIAVLIYGVSRLNSGDIDLPTLMAVFGIASMISTPIRDFSKVFEYRKNYLVAKRIICRFVSEVKTPDSGVEHQNEQSCPQRFRGTIHLVDLKIKEIEVPIAQIFLGEKIAISGDNGSGKSVLLKSIAGILSEHSGAIALDGVPTDQLDEEMKRKYIGIASHDLPLTSGSISKNIRYRNPKAPKLSVDLALARSDLEEIIKKLPNGLDTRLGGRGTGLSEGERSRIKLARAVLDNPPILILDEMERSLDASGKKALAKLIEHYPGTVIFASNDKDILPYANIRWRMHRDKIEIENVMDVEGAVG